MDGTDTSDEIDASLPRFIETLSAYIDAQDPIAAAMRSQAMPTPPWPEDSNPMLASLSMRATEILRDEGPDGPIIWLAVHAWFEGAICDRADATRSSRGPA